MLYREVVIREFVLRKSIAKDRRELRKLQKDIDKRIEKRMRKKQKCA